MLLISRFDRIPKQVKICIIDKVTVHLGQWQATTWPFQIGKKMVDFDWLIIYFNIDG